MTSLLVRLMVPLLLLFLHTWPLPVLGQEGEEGEEQEQHMCDVQCTPYVNWADECIVSDCSGLQQEAGVACVRDCQEGAELCQQLCRQHRHLLLETCKEKCQNASIMDIFCDEECFHQQFDSRFAPQLPDVSPQEQGSSSSDSDDNSGSVEDDHNDKDEDDDVEDEDNDVEDKDDDENFYQYFDELPED